MNISREAHFKIACGMWAVVGTGLLLKGALFLFGGRSLSVLATGEGEPGMAEGIALLVGLIIGFIKGNFVFKKIAKKYSARIRTLPESSPFYMTFSRKSWMMILGMILLGKAIRAVGAPAVVTGGIYVAVGFALVMGARFYLIEQKNGLVPLT